MPARAARFDPLEEAAEALDDLAAGRALRTLLVNDRSGMGRDVDL